MLLAFTNASFLRTGFTNCRESPETGDGLGAQGALSGTTVISGFSDGTLSGVALGLLTVLTTGGAMNSWYDFAKNTTGTAKHKEVQFRDSVCVP